jgi:MraZ protein
MLLPEGRSSGEQKAKILRNLLKQQVLRLTSVRGFSRIGVEFCGKKWSIGVDPVVFRGNSPARIDEKGRLKVPNLFRAPLETKHGRELFVTSLSGEFVRIYPMPVWLDIEEKLGAMGSAHPSKLRFLDRVNYFGQIGELDVQGRVLIPLRLRESATMAGEVDVLGQYNWLDVWNHERFLTKLQRDPYSDDDARALAEFGI